MVFIDLKIAFGTQRKYAVGLTKKQISYKCIEVITYIYEGIIIVTFRTVTQTGGEQDGHEKQ